MRLVRYLFVLIVVLSTSAWAAPTQVELPRAWTQAALPSLPETEYDLRASTKRCVLPMSPAPDDCDRALCLRVDECSAVAAARPQLGRVVQSQEGTGRASMQVQWGQIHVSFSNAANRDDRLQL